MQDRLSTRFGHWAGQPLAKRAGQDSEREEVSTTKEETLVQALGEIELKEIGEQIAEIVRQHGLQKSPDICRGLFSYLSDVIDGWNCV